MDLLFDKKLSGYRRVGYPNFIFSSSICFRVLFVELINMKFGIFVIFAVLWTFTLACKYFNP